MVLALGAAAGCGGAKSSGSAGAATTASGPTSGASGGAGPAGSAGTTGTGAPSATSDPTPTPPAPTTALSEDELKARLLTPADLPEGFAVDADDTSANGTISSADSNCKALADLMNAQGKPPGAVAAADTSFTRSELGPNIATGLAGFPAPAAAQGLLETITQAMHGCTKLTETDKDGSSYDFTVAPLTFPASGDASSATRMSADIGGYPAQIDIVLARAGSTLLYVANTGLGNTDSTLTEDVVKRAVAKLRAPEAPGA